MPTRDWRQGSIRQPSALENVISRLRQAVGIQGGTEQDQAAAEAEHRRRQGVGPGPSAPPNTGPRLTLDPFNRLQSGPRTPTGGSAGSGLLPNNYLNQPQFRPRPRPSMGPSWKPAQWNPETADLYAFMEMIRCMAPRELDHLYNILMKQRNNLQAQFPKTAKRNVEIRNLELKLGKINSQRKIPKPCKGGGGGEFPIASFPGGQMPPVPPAQPRPVEPHVPEPIRLTARYGQEVSVGAPVLDLYSRAAIKGIARDTERIEAEIASLQGLGDTDMEEALVNQQGGTVVFVPKDDSPLLPMLAWAGAAYLVVKALGKMK